MQIVVTPGEISRSFDELMSGEESREEIARWASLVMHGLDRESIRLEPATSRPRIKRALLFLSSIDMKYEDGKYTTTDSHIKQERRELRL